MDLFGSARHVPLKRVGGADGFFSPFPLWLLFGFSLIALCPLDASQTPASSLLLLCSWQTPCSQPCVQYIAFSCCLSAKQMEKSKQCKVSTKQGQRHDHATKLEG